MRFYKAKIILLPSFLIVGFFVSPSYADNANPPIVKSLEEVTTGPYSVGDIITFKVTYEGGNPGIKLIKISGVNNSQTCVGQGIPPDTFDGQTLRSLLNLTWCNKTVVKKNSDNYELVSGFILPCRKVSNSSTGAIVLIEDETGLQNSKLFSYKLTTISDDLFTPVGEIKPTKIADQISIKNIPKSPRKNTVYKLPRLTQGGVPVFWFAPAGGNTGGKPETIDLVDDLDFEKPETIDLKSGKKEEKEVIDEEDDVDDGMMFMIIMMMMVRMMMINIIQQVFLQRLEH
jgi:hypothetical protein